MSTGIEENQAQQTDTETTGESESSENFERHQEGLYAKEDDVEKNDDDEFNEEHSVDSDEVNSDEGKDALESEGAPEEYEEFNLPEGVQYDAVNAELFTEFCKENDWSQEQAQKASDFYYDRLISHHGEIREAQKNLVDSWARQTRTDKEIGGGELEHKLSAAMGLIDKFSPLAMDDESNPIPVLDNNGKNTGRQWTEFGLALAQSGLGNHPAVIRFTYRLSQVLGEDYNYVQSGGTPSVDKTAAETLYGNHRNK